MSEIELPLFADRHNHPYLYATLRAGLDLSQAECGEQAADWIRRRLAEQPPADGEFLLCHGWSSGLGEMPRALLEQPAGVVLFHRSLHQLQINSRAAAQLARSYPDEVQKLEDRKWFELNFQRVLNWFAGVGLTAAGLEEFYRWQRSLGVGYVEELLCCGSRELALFAEAGLSSRTRFWASPATWEQLNEAERREVYGLKLFLDGALGSWTAALLEPYSDQPEHRGFLLYDDYELAELIYRLAPSGKGLAIHAIGDAATQQAVRICRQLGTRLHGFAEVRLEHAQLITREDAEWARRLGLMLCLQPNFSIDSTDYLERLGEQRARLNNPFRMLIDEIGFEPGIDLLFGTDGMPHGAEFAIRQGFSPPFPEQQLTLAELSAGFSGAPVGEGRIVCLCDDELREIRVVLAE
ncbi:MAG: amidohydrolase family protein [Planctomycetota bacterium]